VVWYGFFLMLCGCKNGEGELNKKTCDDKNENNNGQQRNNVSSVGSGSVESKINLE